MSNRKMIFENREDAGLRLSLKLKKYKSKKLLVLGIARGGFIVAKTIARKLQSDLDIIVVRKIGAPYQREFAIGALSEKGMKVFNWKIIREMGISRDLLNSVIAEESEELNRRIKVYRRERSFPNLKGKVIILVDDGLATGLSALVAIKTIKKENPDRIILAVPVSSVGFSQKITKMVDEFVCLEEDKNFEAVGAYYKGFPSVSDEDIVSIIDKSEKGE